MERTQKQKEADRKESQRKGSKIPNPPSHPPPGSKISNPPSNPPPVDHTLPKVPVTIPQQMNQANQQAQMPAQSTGFYQLPAKFNVSLSQSDGRPVPEVDYWRPEASTSSTHYWRPEASTSSTLEEC